jgi:hypothetical protein
VDARFALRETRGGREAYFALGNYDATRALVIDPVLSYSTYLGGSAADFGGYVQVDAGGKLYIAHTTGPDGSFIGASGTGVRVTKLDPVSNTVVFITTIAGSGYDVAQGLAIGASGSGFASYVTGYTASPDFPTCFGALDCAPHGGGEDAFVTVLDETGAIAYSRFLGGAGDDQATGNRRRSRTQHSCRRIDRLVRLPHDAIRAIQESPRVLGGSIGRFHRQAERRIGSHYATYLGGTGADYGTAIALDSSGNMFVGGYTESGNFPRVNPILSATPAMFVTKIGASGGPIMFSTNVGGSGDDLAALAIDPQSNSIYVTGDTSRSNFPSWNGFHGDRDAFVLRIGSSGSQPELSTLIGGSGHDYAGGLALGPSGSGEVYVTGTTSSADFPTVGGGMGKSRWRLGVLRALAIRKTSSTRVISAVAGVTTAHPWRCRRRAKPTFRVWTASTDFPTVNPYRASREGSSDIFVSRILFAPTAPRNVSALPGDGQLT